MSGTTLLLTRHGQTAWNVERRLQGRLDAPLTALGMRQAEALRTRLARVPLHAAYASPTRRTLETARLALAGRDLPVVALDELQEMDLGPWIGLRIDEVPERWAREHHLFWNEPGRYVPLASGESFADLRARAERTMLRLRRRHPGGRILVVTHSLVVKAMWLVAAGRPVEDMWVGSELAGGSLTELRHDHGGWTVERLGDVDHVEEVAACS